ncbi:MAG: hypothetical protein ACXWT0_01795 [Methylobacter sp.]
MQDIRCRKCKSIKHSALI